MLYIYFQKNTYINKFGHSIATYKNVINNNIKIPLNSKENFKILE